MKQIQCFDFYDVADNLKEGDLILGYKKNIIFVFKKEIVQEGGYKCYRYYYFPHKTISYFGIGMALQTKCKWIIIKI